MQQYFVSATPIVEIRKKNNNIIEIISEDYPSETPSPSSRRILTTADIVSSLEMRLPGLGIERIPIVYFRDFTVSRDLPGRRKIDTAKAQRWLDANLSPDYVGPFSTNWEQFDSDGGLRTDPSDPRLEEIVEQYRILYELIRDHAPAAEAFEYNLVLQYYWESAEAMAANNEVLGELGLWDLHGAFGPSIYDHYNDHEVGSERDLERHARNVRNCLKYACRYPKADGTPKDVWLYTWQRRHDGNRTNGFELIPYEDYIKHCGTLLDVEFEGHRPSGLVCWDSLRWFAREAIRKNESGEWANQHANRPWYWDNIRRNVFAERPELQEFAVPNSQLTNERRAARAAAIDSYVSDTHGRWYEGLNSLRYSPGKSDTLDVNVPSPGSEARW